MLTPCQKIATTAYYLFLIYWKPCFLTSAKDNGIFLKMVFREKIPATISISGVECSEILLNNVTDIRDTAHRMLVIIFSHDEEDIPLQKVKKEESNHYYNFASS